MKAYKNSGNKKNKVKFLFKNHQNNEIPCKYWKIKLFNLNFLKLHKYSILFEMYLYPFKKNINIKNIRHFPCLANLSILVIHSKYTKLSNKFPNNI